MSFLKKVFGVKGDAVVQPNNAYTCERVWCSQSKTYDTLYEVFPSGYMQKRGCCP